MIRIDKQWKIIVDENNYQLISEVESEGKDKEGNPKTIISTEKFYYPDIQCCMRRYLTESLRPSESVQQILSKINEVHATIKTIKSRVKENNKQ